MKELMVMTIVSLLFLGFSNQSMARVDISVNIPLPPVITFSAPPELVVIPGTYVYYDPDVDFDLFFYAGYWYRPYREYWYRSVNYEGPWVYIGSPPPVIVSLPPDYRIVTRGYRPIPYWELNRNWRVWQRNRYWDRHNWNSYWQGHRWGRMHEREHGLAPSYSRERGDWGRMQHQREHGLAPSYRGGGQPGFGGGTIHERGGFRGGVRPENRGGGLANPNGGRVTPQNRGGVTHENHERR